LGKISSLDSKKTDHNHSLRLRISLCTYRKRARKGGGHQLFLLFLVDIAGWACVLLSTERGLGGRK